MSRLPRIRTIMLSINLAILLLPIAGIGVLRLYESTLIRKTESSLIAQSVLINAIYKNQYQRLVAASSRYKIPENYGNLVNSGGVPDSVIDRSAISYRRSYNELPASALLQEQNQRWHPRFAELDLSKNTILERQAKPVKTKRKILAHEHELGNTLSGIMREAQVHTLSGMRMVNPQGVIIASTGKDIGLSIDHWQEIHKALAGYRISTLRKRHTNSPSPAIASISRGTKIRVFVATPVIINNRVIAAIVVSRTPATITQSLYHHANTLILLLGLLVLLVIFVSFFTSIVISKPVSAVTDQAKLIASGSSTGIVPINNPKTLEIAELSNAVVKMGNALEYKAEYIKQFASQVSHAFKTPLTSIQGALELLRDHVKTMSDQERNRFLENLESDAKYLELMVSRLLGLANAEMSEVALYRTSINSVLNALLNRAAYKGLTITLSGAEADYFVNIEQTVLESIFQNLVDNTLLHGKGPVSISVGLPEQPKAASNSIMVTYQDSGPGISTANVSKIFTPFFTTARESGGTGLGLAMIRALVEKHGGSIEYIKQAQGACFELHLLTV